jgi:hypothetical protein
MGGVALSIRLKTSIPQLKVIFASGYGGDELAKRLSVATDAVLLSKPFSKTSSSLGARGLALIGEYRTPSITWQRN